MCFAGICRRGSSLPADFPSSSLRLSPNSCPSHFPTLFPPTFTPHSSATLPIRFPLQSNRHVHSSAPPSMWCLPVPTRPAG
ncbi:unnamed protein product [Chondrus crispus]|uniref:Uncharacterized protein n=1 Tax=Chondrus crispus TaxID=2769 RepID=R7QI13_CHOCR|nr:unnamed protein product [Chondrus crispus]CDF37719.1 unnamed protein product [Chondrus crispus]|eukprot:XP_005717590.1 unnamed protein product [Chondrus crispus]